VFVSCRIMSLHFSQLFNEPYEGSWHFSKFKKQILERTLSINQQDGKSSSIVHRLLNAVSRD